jgi:hypothetical protein
MMKRKVSTKQWEGNGEGAKRKENRKWNPSPKKKCNYVPYL